MQEIDTTASFDRTMAAEEYRASLSGIEIGDVVQGPTSESEGEADE